MADFASNIAQMYAQARPQYGVQQNMPGRIPDTGRTSAGYGAIGQGFGQGMSDFVKKAYVDPQAEIMKNKMMMSQDPNTMYKDMINMYTVFKDMPQYLQEQVSSQPGFQAKLQRFEQMFPGYIVPDEKGRKTFATPVLKAEEQKARRVEELRRSGQGELADRLVFSPETKDIAQAGAFNAGATKDIAEAGGVPSRTTYYTSEANLNKTRANLMPDESKADIRYKKEMGEAALKNAETKESKIDPAEAAFRRQEAKLAADEARAERAARAKEALTALGTYSANVRQRQGVVAKGTMSKTDAVVDDASDLLTFLDSTSHLAELGPQQMNLAAGTLGKLANGYANALQEKKDPKVLRLLKQRAYDVYDRFLYRDAKGKIKNALDTPQMKKVMDIFEQQRTVSRRGKELVIPSNLGPLDTLSTKIFGRYGGPWAD